VHPQVNAITGNFLNMLRKRWASATASVDESEMERRIRAFQEHPDTFKVPEVPKIPDGSPIGTDCMQTQPF
jgi:hypothetical protein